MEKNRNFFLKLWIYDELAVDFVEKHSLPQGFQSIVCESTKAASHCKAIIFAVKTQCNFYYVHWGTATSKKTKMKLTTPLFRSLVTLYLK